MHENLKEKQKIFAAFNYKQRTFVEEVLLKLHTLLWIVFSGKP